MRAVVFMALALPLVFYVGTTCCPRRFDAQLDSFVGAARQNDADGK